MKRMKKLTCLVLSIMMLLPLIAACGGAKEPAAPAAPAAPGAPAAPAAPVANTMPAEEKGIMEVSLYPELFMRLNFYNTYQTDLAKAEAAGDPQMIFKAKIKKTVLDDVLEMWRSYRVANDLFPFAFDKEDRI